MPLLQERLCKALLDEKALRIDQEREAYRAISRLGRVRRIRRHRRCGDLVFAGATSHLARPDQERAYCVTGLPEPMESGQQ